MSRTAAGYIFRCKACDGVHLVSNSFVPADENSKTTIQLHCLKDKNVIKKYSRTELREWHGLLWDYLENRVNPFFSGNSWLFDTGEDFCETLEAAAQTGCNCVSLIVCEDYGIIPGRSYIKFDDKNVYLYIRTADIYLSFNREEFDTAIKEKHYLGDIIKKATNLVHCKMYNKYGYFIVSYGKDDKRFKQHRFSIVDDDSKTICSVENLKVRIDKKILKYIKE